MKVPCYPFINATRERVEAQPLTSVYINYVFWKASYYGYDITAEASQIANWLRLNCKNEVFHEANGGTLDVPHPTIKDSTIANPWQRFYFVDPDEAKAFRAVAADFPFVKSMAPTLELNQEGETFALAGTIKFSITGSESQIVFWCWCQDNLKGSVYHERELLIFTDADDLVLFKMTFVGPEAQQLTFDLVNMPHEVMK